ncbi:hypothetical protein D9M71_529820 [compost metagenome]
MVLRQMPGKVDLPSQLGGSFQQGDVVSRKGRDARGLHARRTATHYDNRLRPVHPGNQALGQPRLIAYGRVRRTAHASGEQPADAPLVTGDARAHLQRTTFDFLLDQIGIGDGGANQVDHLRITGTQRLLHIIQCAETTHNDTWHGDVPAHLPGRFKLITHWPVHCPVALDVEIVVALGNIDEIDQSLGL